MTRHNPIVVCCDAFGTLVPQGHHDRGGSPYRLLAEAATRNGIADPHRYFQTSPLTPEVMTSHLVVPEEAVKLRLALERDMTGLTLFPSVSEVFGELHHCGVELWVCSNLAEPYGQRLRTVLPHHVHTLFSYEVGYIKPEPEIYQHLIQQTRVGPERIWFFGDSKRSDVDGPKAAGMHAELVDWTGAGPTLVEALRKTLKTHPHWRQNRK